VIQNLPNLAQRFGVTASYLPVVFAGFFTQFFLLVQALTRWFEDGHT